jgi:hypothetical protein
VSLSPTEAAVERLFSAVKWHVTKHRTTSLPDIVEACVKVSSAVRFLKIDTFDSDDSDDGEPADGEPADGEPADEEPVTQPPPRKSHRAEEPLRLPARSKNGSRSGSNG